MNRPQSAGQVQLWDRLPNEGAKPFLAFQRFLSLGPDRTRLETATRLRRSYSLIRRWAAKFDWETRSRAWDATHNEEITDLRRASWRQFLRRQEEEVQQLWRLGVALVQRFVQRDPGDGQPKVDSRLGPKEVVALLSLVGRLLEQVSLAHGRIEEVDQRFELSWEEPSKEAESGPLSAEALVEGIQHPGLQRVLGLSSPQPSGRKSAGKGRRR